MSSDKPTRTQYYLQMKKNVLQTKVTTRDEIIFSLAAYGLQSDIGEFNAKIHKDKYFQVEAYFPPWVSADVYWQHESY